MYFCFEERKIAIVGKTKTKSIALKLKTTKLYYKLSLYLMDAYIMINRCWVLDRRPM